MKISCLLPTYNRFANKRFPDCTHLLEESIESFLRQTWPQKELIICNDCPEQYYEYPHPDVLVWNVPRRFRSLGEKLNAMAGIATGDLLARWDDDDIYLPWRLQQQAELYLKKGADYICATHAWWWTGGEYEFKNNPGFSQVAFSRNLFRAVGGFPFEGVGEDQGFEEKAVKAAKNGQFRVHRESVTPATAWAINRWATGSEHVSGYGLNGYDLMSKTPVSPGFKRLVPHWREDYLANSRKAAQLCSASA